jgi:aminoglycoside phosphotransferase (APT) family kinase protein
MVTGDIEVPRGGQRVPGVPGIADPVTLAKWMAGAGLADLGELRGVQLISGGRSNLTYRLDLDGGRIVLRRPPLGHVLPTAHDMSREYRVLSALAGTAVPVPQPLASCQDPEIIGAPFYLMRYVEGLVLRTTQDGELLSPAQATELSELLAQMLATIHGVDLVAAGLDTFGRPEDDLVARLTAGLPDPARSEGTLVHGDFRLDNTLVQLTTPARIAAVVDWEMSTLGDPLADLGLTLSYWADAGEAFPDLNVGATVTALPGFYTRQQFAVRYAELTGRDVAAIGYYIAFGYFKLAVVLEGIHARYLMNQTVGEGFEREGPAVPILIARAHQMLDTVS